MIKKSLFLLLVLLLVSLNVRAQAACDCGSSCSCAGGCHCAMSKESIDPDSNKWHVSTIKWVKDHENDLDKDDKFVALVGKVVKQHNGDTYFFTDGTGVIELDSDIKLPVGENIVVRGEIDQAYLHIGPLEIDVESWRHVGKLGEWLK